MRKRNPIAKAVKKLRPKVKESKKLYKRKKLVADYVLGTMALEGQGLTLEGYIDLLKSIKCISRQ